MVARIVEIAHLIKDLTICGLRGYNMCKLYQLAIVNKTAITELVT